MHYDCLVFWNNSNFLNNMNIKTRFAGILLTAGALLLSPVFATAEEEASVRLQLRPYCTQGYSSATWIYGSVPAPGWPLDEDPIKCSPFKVRDPQTLETDMLHEGDELEVDLVIENPGKLPISAVRAWIDFDSTILQGTDLHMYTTSFKEVSPSEQYFDPETSQLKLQASNTDTSLQSTYWVPVVRMSFKVLKEVTPGTVMSFFDVQPGGHTYVQTKDDGQERDVLSQDPGALLVRIGPAEPVLPETTTGAVLVVDGGACTGNADCVSTYCTDGICGAPTSYLGEAPVAPTNEVPTEQGTIQAGGTCVLSSQCASNFCNEGVCKDPETHRNDRTAFSMLQVRNPRVTTEDDVAYLAWDDLRSSMLKAYNVYYGATSGQYIQRKTVPGSSPSVTIRNLPKGTTYYFAVRAVSADDEESAFGQEVAVEIGNPAASTAPLFNRVDTDVPGQNPLETTSASYVPGETGIPMILTFLLLAAAAIGTFMAVRRQTLILQASTNSND